ncbi:Ethylene-responsive transcription factor [Thalictrum thalictroides]|uniref:Ethylene-responsive transcription factor n=1 Tax=Thalictrum thalictroides TaxID=46969 RepID=A0A7J6WA23_THATH|nr:Ethylene-responsive transcription factor [Thalictrum thalictroides]
MGSALKKHRLGVLKQGHAAPNFKGIRMKTWGKWVSEIRKPQSKERIWLGSYDTPEKAARAYDAALYCLQGLEGKFNFNDNERPKIPSNLQHPLSISEIKAVAATFASSKCLSSTSPVTVMNPPEMLNTGVEVESTFDVDPQSGAGVSGPCTFFPDSFLLDELITIEPDSIWALLEETENLSHQSENRVRPPQSASM